MREVAREIATHLRRVMPRMAVLRAAGISPSMHGLIRGRRHQSLFIARLRIGSRQRYNRVACDLVSPHGFGLYGRPSGPTSWIAGQPQHRKRNGSISIIWFRFIGRVSALYRSPHETDSPCGLSMGIVGGADLGYRFVMESGLGPLVVPEQYAGGQDSTASHPPGGLNSRMTPRELIALAHAEI